MELGSLFTADQFMIAATGISGAWIVQDRRERVRRWGCILGLIGQPFWIYSSIQAGQVGVLLVTMGYTASFVRGLWCLWIKPVP